MVEVRPCEAELWMGELSWGENVGQLVWKIIWKGGSFTGETVSKPEIGIRLKNSVVTSTWAWKVWEWIIALLHGNISDFWASSILLSQKWEWGDSSLVIQRSMMQCPWSNGRGPGPWTRCLVNMLIAHLASYPSVLSVVPFLCLPSHD